MVDIDRSSDTDRSIGIQASGGDKLRLNIRENRVACYNFKAIVDDDPVRETSLPRAHCQAVAHGQAVVRKDESTRQLIRHGQIADRSTASDLGTYR
jgi:hypothetical protein